MHADSAYVIGASHKVCQDYARTGTCEGMTYGLISDGCSSSPDTDVGARLLVLSAESLLHYARAQDSTYFMEGTFTDPTHLLLSLPPLHKWQLSPAALDATLLFVTAELGVARFFCAGDGVLASRDVISGYLRLWSIEAPDGFPRYLNYLNHSERREAVEKGAEWTVTGPDGIEFITREVKSYNRCVQGAEVAAVFSDGVHSFLDENHKPVPMKQVVGELMAFKGYQGAFVQRRMQAFLRDAARRGWRHDDDLSMAAVYLGEG